jgi:hypothetical protein
MLPCIHPLLCGSGKIVSTPVCITLTHPNTGWPCILYGWNRLGWQVASLISSACPARESD